MIDPIAKAPDKMGPFGRAWKADLEALRQVPGSQPDATISMWVVEAPWAHPFWHSYLIVMTHLRPVEGLGEAAIYLKGATHELGVLAMDPRVAREPQLTCAPPAYLQPVNFAAQLVEPTDIGAIGQIDSAVDMIIAGKLNPDTDNRQQWLSLFGDSMLLRCHHV